MRAALVALALFALPACEPPPVDVDDGDPSAALWAAHEADREAHLRALSAPILDCIARSDTSSPAFHGCWDWHSAVHGIWATLALARLVGDPAFTAAADAQLTADAVAGELTRVEAGGPFGEVPYGYAWLLRLARERADAGRQDLLPHGRAAAARLDGWIDALSPAGIDTALGADDYVNLSWALVHRLQWARHDGDAARAAEIEAFAADEVLPRSCRVRDDVDALGEFFPPCLHRVLALAAALPPAERAELQAELQDGPPADLVPLVEPAPAHVAGLNFSRAFGLWAAFEATGDSRWRDAYVEHVEAHMAQPAFWAEDYLAHSHWIPQFGVYALALPIDGALP